MAVSMRLVDDLAAGSLFPGGGAGFVMSSVTRYDSSDPSKCYERTETVQFGGDGVVEARGRVRDGGRGVETIGLRRQLGDQAVQVERSRHLQSGEERARRTLHNVEEADIERFDDRWMSAAQRSLPSYSAAAPTHPVPRPLPPTSAPSPSSLRRPA
eukprot:EG_transcript_38895